MLAGCDSKPPPAGQQTVQPPIISEPRPRDSAPAVPIAQSSQSKTDNAARTLAAPSNSSDRVASPGGQSRRRAMYLEALTGVSFADGLATIAVVSADAAAAEASLAAGDAARDQGDLVNAARQYVQALEHGVNPAHGFERLGLVLRRTGVCAEEAIACFRTALGQNAALAEARFWLGMTLQQVGRMRDARVELTELVRHHPDHGTGCWRLAILEYYLENVAEAWRLVHAAEFLGERVPPQFRENLAERTPEPPRN